MTAASAAVYISVADSHWQSGLSLQQFDQLRAKLLPAKMTPIRTNYVEIQQDEMEALRSIYMDDFVEEEAKMGAWNVSCKRSNESVIEVSFSFKSDEAGIAKCYS